MGVHFASQRLLCHFYCLPRSLSPALPLPPAHATGGLLKTIFSPFFLRWDKREENINVHLWNWAGMQKSRQAFSLIFPLEIFQQILFNDYCLCWELQILSAVSCFLKASKVWEPEPKQTKHSWRCSFCAHVNILPLGSNWFLCEL